MATTATINVNLNAKDAQDNVNKLTDSIKDAGVKSANLKTELRQITKELQSLDPASSRFKELSARAGVLKDTIQDTNSVIKATTGNVTENFGRALSNSVQIGIAGFQALSSVQALFGSDNEELNKSLVRFTALLNLTQAIETFGGLGDKITEIRAGFQGLTTATNAQTIAQDGENVATAQGAVATTALGSAMKTLPIIAIAAAIGTLVYGIYQYISANKEAEKQEEKRKKQLEATKKLQKETIEFVAKESTQFTTLIYQLKATNISSERRRDLIKEINGQYGTTFKNLKDEKLFQEQLNDSVDEYMTLQYNKFKLDKNYKFIQDQNEKVFAGEQKINKAKKEAQDLVDKGYRKSVEDALSYREDLRKLIKEGEDAVNKANDALGKLGLRREQLTKVQSDLTDGGKKYTEQVKTETTEIDKQTNAYADLLELIKDKVARQIQAEEELEKTQISRITNVQEREIKSLENQYGDEKQKLIDNSIQREIDAYEEKFKEEGKTQEEYDKAIAEIKLKGDANLLDSEKKLLEQKKIYLDEDIKNIEDKYKLQEEVTLNSITSIQNQSRLIELEYQKEQEIREINNSVLTEEKKQEAILEVKKKYLDQEVQLIQQSGKDQTKALELVKQQQLDNEELTAEQRKEIEVKYNQEVLKVNQDTQDKVQEAIDGTKQDQESALESLTKTIDKVSQYVDKAAELWEKYSDLLSQRNEQEFKNREIQIDGVYDYEKQVLENQLAEGIILREEYDNKIKELDQQRAQEEKQLARQKFEEQKKLQIINAVIQGAQSVLAAYGSGAAVPLIGPITTGPVYAAIAAAFSAAQIGIIANQQFTAAGGGIVPGTGSGMVDSVPSMLAPGETVINAQSSAMYPELLNSINTSGGGISLKPNLPANNNVNPDVKLFGDNKTDKPIRAYVVETEISDTQKRINRIKRSSEF